MATMMKAVQFHEYGGPEVLQIEDTPRPTPGEDEVLVRVRAAGVNPADSKMRSGPSKWGSQDFPRGLGLDFAGVIEGVGKDVSEFQPGDEVYGRTMRIGSYAEYVVVRPIDIAKKPRTSDFAHAAALPTAVLTAWQSLFSSRGQPTIDLQPGQTILIHGAAGGVGSFAVQLAKLRGAKVIAMGRAENAKYLKQLGADAVIDYTKQRFEDVVHDVDAVLDVIGGDTQARSWKVLKDNGVLAATLGIQSEEPDAKARGVRAIAIQAGEDPTVLRQVAKLVDDGQLSVPVSETLPLERAAEAHEHIQSGHTRGKIVLDVA